MKKSVYVVFGFFVMLNASDANAAADAKCSANAFQTKSVHNFPGTGYWLQASGDCKVTHTSDGGFNSQLFNYCTNRPETITNDIDAFPIPGFPELYVHPGMKFYKMGSQTPIFEDSEHQGVYESVGLIEGGGNSGTIRVSAGWSNGAYRDYKVTKTNGNYTFEKKGPVKQVCQNLGGLDDQLPVLNRNGQMIAARQANSQEMKVFKIDASGNCSVARALPRPTSKVSFAFDNNTALYVIQDPQTRKGRLLSMDIATGEERTLSSPAENVTNVSAKADGSIMYTRRGDSGSELVFLNSQQTAKAPAAVAKKFQALGLIWASECNVDVDADSAEAAGKRVKGDVCGQITTDEKVRATLADSPYASVTAAELRSLCGQQASGGNGSSARQ